LATSASYCPAEDQNDGDDEQTHPPAWQRVVHFAQVTVPDVAGGVVIGCHGLGLAAEPQQKQAGDDADQRQACHVQVPEIADEVTHGDSLVFFEF
jgi:hypothetical protein